MRTVNHEATHHPLERVVALEPARPRVRIPESYRDANGHMNMRWYAAIFDDAGDDLYARLGMVAYNDFERDLGKDLIDAAIKALG